MRVRFRQVDWPFASTFRISYRVQTVAESVWVELIDGPLTGRGEGLEVFYHGETIDSLIAQVKALEHRLEEGISRSALQQLVAPGGARNAIDCALWDLEAKRSGRRVWELAGIATVHSLLTAYTLSMDSPAAMAEAAGAVGDYSLLKLKLGGEGDVERVTAVRRARPDVELIVDANQSWNERQLYDFTPKLARLGVKLIEQPLAAGQDAPLLGFKSPIPLCADESCQTTESLDSLNGKYQFVNIKLDKTGGLTEALRLAHAAKQLGFELMVGCMAGSSLSMAPAFVVGQLCSVIDLDGPLLSAKDVPNAIRYEGSRMHAPGAALWG
jgi:L-alanine-DL-glutamate epimerase-like enolase superfamily enzyme